MQSNSKIMSLMQPTYYPWLGYFNLIKQSDIFVMYNTTQLVKRSWQVRNKIKTPQGEIFLTIPVKKTTNRDNLMIKDAEVLYDNKWNIKHLTSIKQAYSKTPYFKDIFPIIEYHLSGTHKLLTDITFGLILDIVDLLNIDTKIVLSSDINYTGKKDHALISMCKELGINRYLSVKGSMDYILDGENLFENNNIDLLWHEYKHPVYKQVNGGFIPYIGIIDALFNIGPEKTKNLI